MRDSKKFGKSALGFLPLTVLLSCHSLGPSSRVELSHDSLVTIGDGVSTERKKGEVIELSETSPILIESAGKISVLALPTSKKPTTIKLSLRNAPIKFTDGTPYTSEKDVNDLIASINEAQVLLSSRRANEALGLVHELQRKHPRLGHLKVIEASCLFVMNRKAQAMEILASLKDQYPDDRAVTGFYRLVGRTVPSEEGPSRTLTSESKFKKAKDPK